MSGKVIDLAEYRKAKEQEKFNASRDRLIADLNRSMGHYNNVTPLAEQIEDQMHQATIEIWEALGIKIIPIDEE